MSSTLSQYEKLKLMEINILKNVGVTGVSVDSKIKGDAYGSGKVRIYVEDINTATRVPETLFGQQVEVIVTGKLRTLPLIALQTSRTSHIRPAPGGVSVGHYAITAGTLSTRVFDSLGRKLILSNNHVLANSNNAQIGDPILQPGAYDGGTIATDKIATLERFIPVKETGNIVDVALARPLNEADVADEVLDIGVVNDVEEAAIGMTVGKSGRCFTEDTLILTNPNGPKTINEIKIGDYAYCYDEKLNHIIKNKIVNIFEEGIRDVFLFKTRNRTLKVTGNHPFLVAVREKRPEIIEKICRWRNKFKSGTSKRMLKIYVNTWKLIWKELKKLKEGDVIVTLNKIDFESETKIGLKLSRFLGYFTGDGSAAYRRGIGGKVSLYASSQKEAEYYGNLMKEIFQRDYKISRRKNCWRVFLYSSEVAKNLISFCPGKKLNKRVPKIIWNLPLNERKEFLEGYCDADGYRYKIKTYAFGSTNEVLIKEIRELCIISGIKVTNVYNRNKKCFKDCIMWEFKAYPSLLRKGFDYKKGFGHYNGIWNINIPEELTLEKITKIELLGKEPTFDIEVENSHNFIANGVLAHNTSAYTEATVTDISATVKISGYAGTEAVFEDQIFTSLLGKAGDSGSLVVNRATKKAVGLLFAGSDTVTCCNKFSHVMEYVHTGLGGGGIGVGGVSPMAFLLPLGLGLVTTYPFLKR